MSLVESKSQAIGWPAPEFSLTSVTGEEVSLSQLLDKKGLLVVFTCNHCPYAKAAWPLLVDLYLDFQDDIEFVAINANDADMYPDDSYKNMQDYASSLNLPFHYLHDKSQEVAKAYQAQCTPDSYLFKVNSGVPELFYHGRINDNWQDSDAVTKRDLKDAIEALINKKEAPSEQPPSLGCSIKWKHE